MKKEIYNKDSRMKLILTSNGLCNDKIRKTLVRLVGKKPQEINVLAVSLPLIKSEEKKYARKLNKEFSKMGIKNCTITHLKKRYSYDDIKDFDIIYMCGGNTFYHLDVIRKKGFDKILRRFVKEGKVYFGASAGAALACPNIDYVSWSKHVYDENILNLKNLNALNFIDYLIMPHVNSKVAKELKSFKNKSRYKVIPLTNSQGIIFTGRNEYKLI